LTIFADIGGRRWGHQRHSAKIVREPYFLYHLYNLTKEIGTSTKAQVAKGNCQCSKRKQAKNSL